MDSDPTYNLQRDIKMNETLDSKKIKQEVSPLESVEKSQVPLPQQQQQKASSLQGRLTTGSKHDLSFLCVVCTDKASGYHYGVPACEGCKAFFKRSLQSKELNYKCPATSNCTIDKLSRKCCQACRLKKCTDVGMSKEFLGNKIKRPKSDKDKPKSRSQKLDSKDLDEYVESTITPQEMELENVLRSLSAIHADYYMEPKLLVGAKTIREKFCRIIDQQLVHIIDWAKQLPGYCNLVISDQALLLQAAWVDLLVLNWVYHSTKTNDCVSITKFFTINYDESLELEFDNIYMFLLSLASRVKKYIIDEEEISCLKAISLTNAESSNLSSLDKVTDLITMYSSALQYFTATRYRSNPQKFAKLVLILPQLKYLVNQVMEFLYKVKMNDSYGYTLSDIVIEMLEAKQRL